MDGNRRWATSRWLPKLMGHKYWFENVKNLITSAIKFDIDYITLWALSVDNLNKRDSEEIKHLIKLINNIEKYIWEFFKQNIVFKVIWDIKKLPLKTQEILNWIVKKTSNNSGLVFTVSLVYWWQDEIIRATKKIIKANIDPETLTREEFRKYLDTSFLPNPDLIIRTWWDKRHSWFLLYDSEYSEYYFTEKKWPEFDEKELLKAIDFFKNSKRNFWK